MQRRTMLKQLAGVAGLGLALPRLSLAADQQGFIVLEPPIPTDVAKGKVEMLEFFHYGCPHCRHFDPMMAEWLKHAPADLQFKRVPVIWGNPQLKALAQFYYTEVLTGTVDKLHPQVFAALQDDKVPLNTAEGVQDWVASKGVDAKSFMEVYHSFSVAAQVQRANQLGAEYKIQGVPTLAIDGKFVTSAAMTGSHEAALKMADQLIVRARKEQSRA